jgi:hypothetical protein
MRPSGTLRVTRRSAAALRLIHHIAIVFAFGALGAGVASAVHFARENVTLLIVIGVDNAKPKPPEVEI